MIEVAAALIENFNSQVLLTRRPLQAKLGGLWEFPGGKLENNETPKEALQRELKEELNLDIQNFKYLMTYVHDYEFGAIKLISYIVFCPNLLPLKLNYHTEAQWVSAKDIHCYPLAPADRPLLTQFLELKENAK